MMEVKKTPATALEFKNMQSLSNGLISNIVPCKSDNVDKLSFLPKDDSEMEQNEETNIKEASRADTKIVKEPVDSLPKCDATLKSINESETPKKDSVLSKELITDTTLEDDKNDDNHENIEKTTKPKLSVEVIEADQHMKNEKLQGREAKPNNEEKDEIDQIDKKKIDLKKTKELLCEVSSKRHCEINTKDKTKLNEESKNNEKNKELLKESKREEYNLAEIVKKCDNEKDEAVRHERQSSENKTEKNAEIDEGILKRKSVTVQSSSSSCNANQEIKKKKENDDIVKLKSKTKQISADNLTEADQSVSAREKIEDYNENQNISTDNKENKTEVPLSAMQCLKATTKSNNSNAPVDIESSESKQKGKKNLGQDDKLSEAIRTDHNSKKKFLSSQKKINTSSNFSKDELSKEKPFETAPSDNFKEKESKNNPELEKNKNVDILLPQKRTPTASSVSSSLLTHSKSPLVDGDIINLDSPLPEDEIEDTKEEEENEDILKQIDCTSTNSGGTEEKSKEPAQTYSKKQSQSEDDDDVVMFYQKTKTDNTESDEDVVIVEKKTEEYKSCTGLKKSTSKESITTPKGVLLLDDVKEQDEESVSMEKDELYNKKKLQDLDEMQVEEEIFSFDTRLGDRQKNDTKVQEDDDDVVLLECESDNATESIIPQKPVINTNTLTNAKENSGSTSIEEKSIINTNSFIAADSNEKVSTAVAVAVTDKTKNIKKNEVVDLDLEDEKSENDKRTETKNITNKSNPELTCTSRQVEDTDVQEIPKASEIVELDSEKEDEQIEPEFKHAEEQIIEPDTKLNILVSDNSDNAQDKFPENLLAHDSKSRDSENLLQATSSPQNSRSNDATIRSKTDPEIGNLESSAEPPLKRARVEKINDKDPQKLVNEKENSFKGSVSPDPLTQESKKIKLFHEDELAGKVINEKLEDSHLFKAKRVKKEKLEPTPQASKKVDINLDFLRKFKKSITEMTKSDLEELVLQKVVEAIVYKSEFSEMREMIEKQETTITTHRTKLAEITKQFRDLEMVHNRVLKDLETKNQQFIMPVKITRAVGLQVLIPKRIDQTGAKSSVPATVSQQTTSQSSSNALNSTKRRSASKVTPFRPETTQQVASRSAPTVPISTPQKIDALSPQNKAVMQHKVVNRNTVALPQQNLNQLSLTNSAQTQYIVQQSQVGQTSSTQQMTLKKSASFVRTQQNPAVIQKSQISQNAADRRVPPMILKKTSANGRILQVASPDTVTPSVSTAAQNTSFAAPGSKSVIDLTDEDDANSKAASSASLPALVAIPNHAISTRVTYVVNQPNNIASQRVTITQNGATVQKIPKTKMNTQFVTIAPKPTSTSSVLTTSARLPATTILRRHPAPLPKAPASISNPSWKNPPPRPSICINNDERGIVISWTMDDMNEKHAEVTSYQIYAYQETNAVPAVEAWRHVGDVKAMLLPMAVTLTQFQEGQRYYFAVRAVDIHTRCGPFSMPITWT